MLEGMFLMVTNVSLYSFRTGLYIKEGHENICLENNAHAQTQLMFPYIYKYTMWCHHLTYFNIPFQIWNIFQSTIKIVFISETRMISNILALQYSFSCNKILWLHKYKPQSQIWVSSVNSGQLYLTLQTKENFKFRIYMFKGCFLIKKTCL